MKLRFKIIANESTMQSSSQRLSNLSTRSMLASHSTSNDSKISTVNQFLTFVEYFCRHLTIHSICHLSMLLFYSHSQHTHILPCLTFYGNALRQFSGCYDTVRTFFIANIIHLRVQPFIIATLSLDEQTMHVLS